MFSASLAERPSGARPVMFVMIGVAVAALLAATVAAVVFLWSPARALSAPFIPSEATGYVADTASLADTGLPAIAQLDAAVRTAMQDAAAAAAAEGITFEITSGWRSREYQQWLLDEAIETYGSEATARQFVATPDRSRHVTGQAVDIGPTDAQWWLMLHGSRWGLCQIYANESWHFELATEPGGECPALLADAEG